LKIISVFDTTISDYNLGNEIIMDGVYKQLRELFPDDFFFKLPYMEITRHTLKYIRKSDLIFFGGTNSLTSRMERYRQWGINLLNSIFIKNVVLMGLGWWQYQQKESLYTKILLNRVLNKELIHSVRDSYTEQKLCNLGYDNVLNTACPSMWNLTPDHCIGIKKERSEQVIFTLTDYSQNVERDTLLYNTLQRQYKKVYVWLQGVGDKKYVENICKGRVEFIAPNLHAFDEALAGLDADYVGTRLHAGIRALQHKRRTLIIAIDNRAIEINRDFNIPVLHIDELERLPELIESSFATEVKLPLDNITKWKKQFTNI
jgi:polysaccharide pyruvyl transferase WcaK-like protein